MKVYNKLVRDKIAEIINSKQGQVAKTLILDDKTYLKELNKNLQEELNEYLASGEVEELADLEEVLRAVLKFKKVSVEEFEKIRQDKVDKRGAFDKKLFLVGVEEEDK